MIGLTAAATTFSVATAIAVATASGWSNGSDAVCGVAGV